MGHIVYWKSVGESGIGIEARVWKPRRTTWVTRLTNEQHSTWSINGPKNSVGTIRIPNDFFSSMVNSHSPNLLGLTFKQHNFRLVFSTGTYMGHHLGVLGALVRGKGEREGGRI